MNKVFARKINKLAREDQGVRRGHKKGKIFDTSADKKNTNELKKIIKKYGWPTISLVGKKASFNAWLLAQHADHDRKFQSSILKLLIKIYDKNRDIDRANIAYLTDRLLTAKNKKQIFGTQFSFDKIGRLKLNPIKNLKIIGKLRREYNLPPLKKYMNMAGKFNASLKK
jgi:hypothetical protein